jgi:hypothetical protein
MVRLAIVPFKEILSVLLRSTSEASQLSRRVLPLHHRVQPLKIQLEVKIEFRSVNLVMSVDA